MATAKFLFELPWIAFVGTYDEYLNHWWWRDFREGYKAANPFCVDRLKHRDECPLEIHHLYYRDEDGTPVLGQEWDFPDCVISVCGECHEKRHDPSFVEIFAQEDGLVEIIDSKGTVTFAKCEWPFD
jgi:hypothetical protein